MGITCEQALDCCHSDDLIGIGMEADAIRRTLHPEGVVTYTVDRSICITAPDNDLKIAEALDYGATGLTLLGTLPTLAAWENQLTAIRASYPSLWLHGLTATAIATLAPKAGLSIIEALKRLRNAGLGSLSGADAALLSCDAADRCSATDWLTIHRTAHILGVPSTATMLFGDGESLEDRVAHLEALHTLQQETGGFLSFQPVAITRPRSLDDPTAIEYLKTLSISRMFLDTIPNLQADWPTQGLKVLQMAIRFGANDAGSTLPGESLTSPDGTAEEDIRRIIRGAGLRPAQRDTPYRTLFLT